MNAVSRALGSRYRLVKTRRKKKMICFTYQTTSWKNNRLSPFKKESKYVPLLLPEVLKEINTCLEAEEMMEFTIIKNKIHVKVKHNSAYDFDINFFDDGKIIFSDYGNFFKDVDFMRIKDRKKHFNLKSQNNKIMTLLKIKTISHKGMPRKAIMYYSSINEIARSFYYYLFFLINFDYR